jgi:hypothetical protein
VRAVLKIRREPYYRAEAFRTGLQRVGFTLMPSCVPEGPEDWLLVWNLKRGPEEKIAQEWERNGGTVIVVENGYLQKVDKTYYAISVHGHNGSGWFPVGAEDRFTKLGIPMKPWGVYPVDGYRLICCQRGIGSALMHCPGGWSAELFNRYRRNSTAFKMRPHPGNFAPKVPLTDDLRGCVGVDIWSSAAGVQALVEGKAVKHSAPHWICEGGGSSDVGRQLALHRMSHAQWHHDEVATGEPFARIIAQRAKAVW